MAAADPIAPTTTRALRVLALAYFVQATGALSVVGALAAISAEWGLSDALSASLVSVFGVTFALAAPTLQVLLGHLERRRQVLLGLTLFSAAALLLAAAPGYEVMLVARVLMGLGAAFIGPVLGALGSGLVPAAQQGSAIAMVLLGLSVAGLVGMPLSAWLAHVAGARGLFLAVAVAGALTALLVRAWVPQGVAGQRVRAADLLAMLVQPRWISGFLVAFFMSASVYTTYTFLVPILRDVFHAEPSLVSVALAVLGVAGILGNLVVTRAARR
ncbi:MAG: MFS transporter, partial [Roseateles sp.]